MVLKMFNMSESSLRIPKVFALQILRRYLTKEGRVRKFFVLFNMVKEPCVRKFERLARSKVLGISQTKSTCDGADSAVDDSDNFMYCWFHGSSG